MQHKKGRRPLDQGKNQRVRRPATEKEREYSQRPEYSGGRIPTEVRSPGDVSVNPRAEGTASFDNWIRREHKSRGHRIGTKLSGIQGSEFGNVGSRRKKTRMWPNPGKRAAWKGRGLLLSVSPGAQLRRKMQRLIKACETSRLRNAAKAKVLSEGADEKKANNSTLKRQFREGPKSN